MGFPILGRYLILQTPTLATFVHNQINTLPHLRRFFCVLPEAASASSIVVDTEPVRYTPLSISDALTQAKDGDKIEIKGWVSKRRKTKAFTFLEINDGLAKRNLQAIMTAEFSFKHNVEIDYGSAVHLQGTIKDSPGREQAIELIVDKIQKHTSCPVHDFPFAYKEQTSEDWKQLRRFMHLRPKIEKYRALLRLRSDLFHIIHDIMRDLKFQYITTPILTSNNCEGGCDVFKVTSQAPASEPFFKNETMLTVSGQLHLEIAATGLSRVYTISPAFRAENCKSRRHLAEFTMFEAEEAFVEDVETLMDRAEYILHAIVDKLYTGKNPNLEAIIDINKYKLTERLTKKFFRITYDEAVELINKKQDLHPLEYGKDLVPYHEKLILDYFEQIPTFITEFPAYMKPFYMKRSLDKALGFDLICAVSGEVCGGSLREEDHAKLCEQIGDVGGLEWYSDIRKYGSAPHGGFGFGFDRIIQAIAGMESIKDVVPFPRWAHNCKF